MPGEKSLGGAAQDFLLGAELQVHGEVLTV